VSRAEIAGLLCLAALAVLLGIYAGPTIIEAGKWFYGVAAALMENCL
jgi:hypothetical protein